MENRLLDAYGAFADLQRERMAPMASPALTEAQKEQYRGAVEGIRNSKEMLLACKNEGDFYVSTEFEDMPLRYYFIHAALLLIPMILMLLARIPLFSLAQRSSLESFCQHWLWVFFIPPVLILFILKKRDKIDDYTDMTFLPFIKFGTYIFMAVQVLRSAPLFGSVMNWIPAYFVFNFIVILIARLLQRTIINNSLKKSGRIMDWYEQAEEDLARHKNTAAGIIQGAEAVYQNRLNEINSRYGVSFTLPKLQMWFLQEDGQEEMFAKDTAVMSFYERSMPGYFSGKPDQRVMKKTLKYVPGFMSITESKTVESFDAFWEQLDRDAARALVSKEKLVYVPLPGIALPEAELDDERLVFWQRKTRWKEKIETVTQYVSTTSTTVQDTERQERYAERKRYSDISNMGTTAESLQYVGNADIAQAARDLVSAREKEMKAMTKEETTKSLETETETEIKDRGAKGCVIVERSDTHQIMAAYYPLGGDMVRHELQQKAISYLYDILCPDAADLPDYLMASFDRSTLGYILTDTYKRCPSYLIAPKELQFDPYQVSEYGDEMYSRKTKLGKITEEWI